MGERSSVELNHAAIYMSLCLNSTSQPFDRLTVNGLCSWAVSGLTIPFVTADVGQRDAAESLALNLIWIK
jgi:hypothetical protein